MRVQRIAAILTLMGVPAVAWGGTTSGVASKPTERSLTANTAQIALLKQQREIAKLKAEIASSKTGGSSSTGAAARTVPAGQNQVTTNQQASAGTLLPEIVSVVGTRRGVQAILRLATGAEVMASPGEALPGGLTVHSVDADGVSVMQSGNLVPLAFATGEGGGQQPARATAPQMPPAGVLVQPNIPEMPAGEAPGGQMPGQGEGH